MQQQKCLLTNLFGCYVTSEYNANLYKSQFEKHQPLTDEAQTWNSPSLNIRYIPHILMLWAYPSHRNHKEARKVNQKLSDPHVRMVHLQNLYKKQCSNNSSPKISKNSKYMHQAFFFLDLSITYPMNMQRKQRSTMPANTGIRMAYSWGRKYRWMK